MQKSSLYQFDVHEMLSIRTLNRISYYHYSENFVFNGEYHDSWELVYVDSGEVVIQADAETFVLPQKTCFLHLPDEFHSIRSNNTRCKVLIISFQCRQGAKLLQMLCRKVNNVSSEQLTLLKNILDEYIRNFDGMNLFDIPPSEWKPNENRDISLYMIRNNLEIFFLSVLRAMNEKKQKQEENMFSNPIVSKIISYLTENLNSDIKLDDLAHEIGYSQSYLSKLFHQATKLSITSYLINLRIERAKFLLSDMTVPIQDIATRTGFSSLQYFSKTFKQKTGYTPSDFRKSIEIHQRYDFDNH